MRQSISEAIKVNDAIREEFGYESGLSMNWQNGERSWTFSFTSFDLEAMPYKELKTLTNEIHEFILEEFEESEEIDFIIFNFTPEESFDENTREKVEIRFDH